MHTLSVRRHLCAFVLAAFVSPAVFAHGTEQHKATQVTPGRDASQAQLQISPGARDAVAAVERFASALSAGDVEKAGVELDASVLILESGGAEYGRETYLGGHAKSDASFLKGARLSLKRRTAESVGDLAWVASESEIHAMKGEEMLMISSTETMVLRKTGDAWKIVHIHWSSRRAGRTH